MGNRHRLTAPPGRSIVGGFSHARTAGDRSITVDMRHMVETHWTEQRSEDQIDYLE